MEESDSEENDDDDDSDSEDDQSDAESEDGEDTQPSKTKPSKPTARKTVPKNAALTKAAARRAAPLKPPPPKAASGKGVRAGKSDLSKVQAETSGGLEANDDAEADTSEDDKSRNEHGVDTTAEAHISDDELSSRSYDEVEQLQEAHEREQLVLNKQATDPSSGDDTRSQKRKLADLGAGLGEKESTTKKRHSA